MKTKWMNFFILWGMLVLVQVSTAMIVDFTSNIAMVITTSIGSAITLYLGLKVERKRVRREVQREEDDRRLAGLERLREAIASEKVFVMPEHVDFKPTFESPIINPHLFDYSLMYPKPIVDFLPRRQPSSHIIIDGDEVYADDGMLSRIGKDIDAYAEDEEEETNRDAYAEDEEEDVLRPVKHICKHCYREIKGAVHAEGMASGRMRCDPEDSQLVYGYNAEPTNGECGPTCMGYK